MPIVYNKLFDLLVSKNLKPYDLRKNNIVGVATLEKMRKAEGHIDTRTFAIHFIFHSNYYIISFS